MNVNNNRAAMCLSTHSACLSGKEPWVGVLCTVSRFALLSISSDDIISELLFQSHRFVHFLFF